MALRERESFARHAKNSIVFLQGDPLTFKPANLTSKLKNIETLYQSEALRREKFCRENYKVFQQLSLFELLSLAFFNEDASSSNCLCRRLKNVHTL